jgi:hypothetical protein
MVGRICRGTGDSARRHGPSASVSSFRRTIRESSVATPSLCFSQIPLASDDSVCIWIDQPKCKTRVSNPVTVAAPRELGYLAVILALVGLTSASSGPHAAPGASGLL